MGKGNFQLRVSFTHLYFLFGDSLSLFLLILSFFLRAFMERFLFAPSFFVSQP